LRRLVEEGGGGREVQECQKLIVKFFWCSTQFVMPPYLAEAAVLDGWMEVLVALLERPVAGVAPRVDDAELAAMPEFKTKKWIGNVLLRFLRRYSNLKRVPTDEPHTRVVVARFSERWAPRATAAMLQVLSWPTQPGGCVSGRVANLAIEYLQEAVETASLWAVILPHIHLLLSRIIFPYLCFSDADAELWEEDPIEYVRKQADINEDYTSPRTAAMSLLSQLSELRATNTVLPFMTHLVTAVLEPYRAAAVGSQARAALAREKVGAMHALSACKLRLMSKPELTATFLEVLAVHVEPDRQSEFGFLRATTHKLLGDVASSGWEPFNVRMGESALRGAVAALEDPELPVQATAGGALHYLMEQDAAQPLIAPFAPQLLERLLVLMDKMSDGFISLLPTLDRLVDRYPDELMPLAVPLMRRLVAAFGHSAAEARQQGDDEDGDDDLMFQAAQMLQLISSVLTTAGEWSKPTIEERAAMFRVLEAELQPVLLPMFDDGNQVFAEETLDVLHTLILQTGELNGSLSPFLIGMVPRLVKSFDTWAGEYVSSDIVGPLEAYLAYDMPGLVAMEGALPAIASIAQRLWAEGMFDDSEAVDGAKIADALILGLCSHAPTRGSDQTKSVIVSLAREAAKRCMATTGGEGPLRVRLFGTAMLTVYYDAGLVVHELGGVEAVMSLVSLAVSDMEAFVRVHDKKAVVLGLSAMLRVEGLGLEQRGAGLVRGILGLQNQIDQQRAGEEQKNSVISQYAKWAQNGSAGGGGGVDVGNGSGAMDASVAAERAMLLRAGAMPGGGGGGDDDDERFSELNDDEDATNRLLDDADGVMDALQKLSAETGIPVAELKLMNATGGMPGAATGIFDFEGMNADDDEGDNPTSGLDDIDELGYFVESARVASGRPWWATVGQGEREAIDQLARRIVSAGQ
jgi:importin-7